MEQSRKTTIKRRALKMTPKGGRPAVHLHLAEFMGCASEMARATVDTRRCVIAESLSRRAMIEPFRYEPGFLAASLLLGNGSDYMVRCLLNLNRTGRCVHAHTAEDMLWRGPCPVRLIIRQPHPK